VDLGVLPNSYVWVPEAQDYGGICDRWLVAPRDKVMATLDILQPVVSKPHLYEDFIGNPEALVKRRFNESGIWQSIRRFGRRMFTAAAPGDRTRAPACASTRVGELWSALPRRARVRACGRPGRASRRSSRGRRRWKQTVGCVFYPYNVCLKYKEEYPAARESSRLERKQSSVSRRASRQ